MTLSYYHLIWAAGLSGGLILCRINKVYYWFSSWGHISLTAVIIASLLSVLIFLSVCRASGKYYCVSDTTQDNNHLRCCTSRYSPNKSRFNIMLAGNGKGAGKLLPLLLYFFSIIFVILGVFCGARLQDCNLKGPDKKLQEILNGNGNASIVIHGRISSHPKDLRGSIRFKVDAAAITVIDSSSYANTVLEDAGEIDVMLKNFYSYFPERDELVRLKGSYRQGKYNGYILVYNNGFEKVKNRSPASWPFIIRKAIYKCIRNTIYGSLEYRHAAICEAAVLGNSANINESQAKDFINSGIYHLLAISGLHISFFAVLSKTFAAGFVKGFTFCRPWKKIQKNLSIFMVLGVLLLYNFVIGEKASVLRATVMSVFVLFSANWGKAINKKAVLSFTYLIMLVINPSFFTEVSFWLSFLSVAAIIYLNDIVAGLFDYLKKKIVQTIKPAPSVLLVKNGHIRKPGYFASIFITSLSVNIFIFPVIMCIFGSTGIFAVILNIAAVPVFYAVLFILIIASFAAIIWPPFGSVLLKPVSVPLHILIKLSEAWKISGASIIRIDEFGPIYVILYYTVMCALSFAASKFLNRRNICLSG